MSGDEAVETGVVTDDVVDTVADGRGRRRTAVLVVVSAILAGVVGGFIGNRIESPADRAAARAAPVPSLITVPVELRSLSSELVLAGQVNYNEPTLIQLAGNVGIGPGEAAVVTDVRAVGDVVQEGDVLLEVTGRPVLALQGQLPMYRRLVIGGEGPDVTQLEEALARLGYDPGTRDSVFDTSTAAAVEQMYSDAGYVAEGPSVDERDALTDAQDAVRQAEDNLRTAEEALASASRPMLESERLQLDRTLASARAAVPAAEDDARRARVDADQSVAAAAASRDAARTVSDAAVRTRDLALSGAVDPDTGEPYTADRISALEVEVAQARESLVAAEAAVVSAENERARSVAAADQAIADARFQLQLAEAQYAEGTASGDTSALSETVASAGLALAAATTNLTALQAATGLRISPGEIVFVPALPSNVTESFVTLGSTVQGPVGTLATSSTLVTARVSRVDSGLVAVGAPVAIEIRGAGVTTTGTVLNVGTPTVPASDPGDQPVGPSEGTGRLEVAILPDAPAVVADYVFWDARVVVMVASTDGEVLVVPVAALTVGPDQVSQVEVERVAATDDQRAVTEVVEVEVGLTASGLAEVRPLDAAALDVGDRVVVGVETNERLNEVATHGPTVPGRDDEPDDDADDGADDDGESSGGYADSDNPLAALLGWEANPIEDRRRQLEVEELTADCMRDQGFEYQPVDWSAQSNPEDELQFSDPVAFGEKYGYGVMRSYELYELGGGEGQAFEDPNQEYVNSLSPDEQTAYYEALYGAAFEEPADVDGEFVEPAPEAMGCSGIASAEVWGERELAPEVEGALEDYFANLASDPRLEDAHRAWAGCMAPVVEERGLDPAPQRPDEMWNVINRLKTEAQGLEAIPVSSEAEMNEYFESGEPVYSAETNENGEGFVYLGEPSELSADEIERLTAIEVELWKQDQACQDDADVKEVQRQIELDVVDQLVSRFPELAG
jgi:peptidoglycan hydrolase-like protein with peptidoglycan-binding domain